MNQSRGRSIHTDFSLTVMVPNCSPRSAPLAQTLAENVCRIHKNKPGENLPPCFQRSKHQCIRSGLACVGDLEFQIVLRGQSLWRQRVKFIFIVGFYRMPGGANVGQRVCVLARRILAWGYAGVLISYHDDRWKRSWEPDHFTV